FGCRHFFVHGGLFLEALDQTRAVLGHGARPRSLPRNALVGLRHLLVRSRLLLGGCSLLVVHGRERLVIGRRLGVLHHVRHALPSHFGGCPSGRRSHAEYGGTHHHRH